MNYCLFDDMPYYCNRTGTIDINAIGCELCEIESEMSSSLGTYPDNSVIIGTCCVTERSQKASAMLTEMLSEIKDKSFKFVTGCDVQYRNMVYDAYYSTFKYLFQMNITRYSCNCYQKYHITEKDKQYIKVQSGCYNKCSYCCVNKARDEVYSIPYNIICKNIDSAIKNGKTHIELVGTQIMIYKDTDIPSIVELCRNITTKYPNITLTLNSLNPGYRLIDDLCDLICNTDNMLKQVYLSVQSGSDKVLHDMKRYYKISKVKKLYKKYSNKLSFCYDIICGYPTETKNDFHETLQFIHECKPFEIMVCRYSPRKLTESYNLEPLSKDIVEYRYRVLNGIIQENIVPLSHIPLQTTKLIKLDIYNTKDFIKFCRKLENNDYCKSLSDNNIKIEVEFDSNKDKDQFELHCKLLTIRYGVKIQIVSENSSLNGNFLEYMNDWRYL